MSDPPRIAIFAKAPIPGFAKTRLIPAIGADAAAALQAELIYRAVAVARAAQLGPITLWCTPDKEHICFRRLAAQSNLQLFEQCPGDLGSKMQNAFERLEGPLLLMGTDCLVLEPHHLHLCAAELGGGADGVFLPVEDGGYVLVGLHQPSASIFDAIPWNTGAVMATTRVRARAASLQIAEPATLWDLDTPEDYARAVKAGLIPLSDQQTGDRSSL